MSRSRLLFALALGLTLALPATGHNVDFPMPGDDILVRTNQGPGTQTFSFDSAGGNTPAPSNPASLGSALLVRGVGANGGRTELIDLDFTKWSANGGGYVYTDGTGARGGVTNVSIAAGSLSIDASGSNWSWEPAGAQDEVWVHFRIEEEWYCAQFTPGNSTVANNTAGHFSASGAPAPVGCPAQVCGNGDLEFGEECDDGNLTDGDGCDVDCTIGTCEAPAFSTTFEGIRSVIFESPAYGCSFGACHDINASSGGLSLDANSDVYLELLGASGQGQTSTINPLYPRVLPSEPQQSVLYLKLLKKKLEGLNPGYQGPEVGSSMPIAFQALSDDHLEALRLWIRGGAPEDLVVEGTAELLGTCLPPPDPLKATPPDPPAMATGFQLQQTARPLLGLGGGGQGEDEVCLSIYYDLTGRVPAEAVVPCPPAFQQVPDCSAPGAPDPCEPTKNAINDGSQCAAFNYIKLVQDGQSHHSILSNYTGASLLDDPAWGPWTYKLEPTDPDYATKHGQPCSPDGSDAFGGFDPQLGYNPGCSSEIVDSVACLAYGPSDLSNFQVLTGGGGNLPQILISQETFFEQDYPEGVFRSIPLKGVLVWNSHAFNLTQEDSTLAQYLNMHYATASEQVYPAQDIFAASTIFSMYVPPFETQEICGTATFPVGTRISELSSHTHQRGVRWRTWGPPNTPCKPECPADYSPDPFLSLMYTFQLCGDPALPLCGGPRLDEPMYVSTSYSDPVQMILDPPLALDDPDIEDRTFYFCSLYDNGSTASSPAVKRFSTSPLPPQNLATIFGISPTLLEVLGGPCPISQIHCLGGDNEGALCGAIDAPDDADCPGGVCDPGTFKCVGGSNHDAFCGGQVPNHAVCTGGGTCDACAVHGGVTTEDEMFILLGIEYAVPEPALALAQVTALGALTGLAWRRRRATTV